jgi:hypothetical protein
MLQTRDLFAISEFLKKINTENKQSLKGFAKNIKDMDFAKEVREKFEISHPIDISQEERFQIIRHLKDRYHDSNEGRYRTFLIDEFKNSIDKLPSCMADRLLDTLSYGSKREYDEVYKYFQDKFWKK